MKFLPAVLLCAIIWFSCKKSNSSSNNTTYISAQELIDSITGSYSGTTSGDSIYYYVDTAGKVQYGIRSFSVADSLVVTSADTNSITVASRFYSVTFPYVYYYTGSDSVTILQQHSTGTAGNIISTAILVDTANNINHINFNMSAGQNKRFTSSFALYKR